MAEKLVAWDPVEILDDDPALPLFYLEEALSSGDGSAFARALGVVARTKNFAALARNIGLSRTGLIKALSTEGNPTIETVLKVMTALGLELHVSKSSDRVTTRTAKAGEAISATMTRRTPKPRAIKSVRHTAAKVA